MILTIVCRCFAAGILSAVSIGVLLQYGETGKAVVTLIAAVALWIGAYELLCGKRENQK